MQAPKILLLSCKKTKPNTYICGSVFSQKSIFLNLFNLIFFSLITNQQTNISMRGKFLHSYWLLGLFYFLSNYTQAQHLKENGVLMVKWKNSQYYAKQRQHLQQTFGVSQLQLLGQPTQLSAAEQLIAQQHDLLHLTSLHIAPTKVQSFIAYLQQHNLAHYIEPVTYSTFSSSKYNNNDALSHLQWGLDKAKVQEAWAISKGNSNIIIGIVDSGILPTHEDLRNKLHYNEAERQGTPNRDDDQNGYIDDSLGYDFANRDANVQDAFWHGTCVAGVAAAQTDNNIGIAGVGFQAKILPIKVIRDISLAPTASNASIYEGIMYAANRGCQIINVSLINGGEEGVYFQHQQDIINYATLVKKALVVVAAGNNNLSSNPREAVFYPASYQNVLAVASTDRFDERSQSAIVNHFIDLAAPGEEIQTTHILATNSYIAQRGSSFAAPFVAGAAALLKAHYPDLTGLQIGELLRVSTDNIYNIPANQPYKDKLGTGRINVEKAFAQKNTAMAVRLQEFNYENKWGKFAHNDDTIKITGTFVNYLNKINNLQITLQSTSPYVTVLQANYQVPQLNTLDSAQNTQIPFVVYLHPNTPANTKLVFKLNYTSGNNYTDYQYFIIETNEETHNLTWNEVKLSVAANGRIGYTDAANKKGLGVLATNNQVLKEAGLLLNYQNKVPNCVLTTPNNKANHFRATKQARIAAQDLQKMVLTADFTDDNAGNHQIGLKINQQVTARINTPHHQYVLVSYTLTNNSPQDIDSLAVGLFADWDIGNGQQNYARWQQTGKFGYTFAGSTFMGIKVFGGNGSTCLSIDKNNASNNPNNLNLQDSFALAEKIFSLQNGLQHTTAGGSFGADVAQVIGTKIGNLKRGQSQTITFALMTGTSLTNLEQTAQEASKALNPLSSKGLTPTTVPFVCAEKMRITPQKGTNFRFYNPANLGVPFYIGNSLQVNAADTAKIYYISQVDSTLESELQHYQFKIKQPQATFYAIDSLNLADSSKVLFSNGSPQIVRSDWNFGDNSFSNLTHPTHHYTKTGIYSVVLTVTDSLGCTASKSMLIKVVRLSKSLLPVVTAVKVCAKEPAYIKPQNGTKFRFYADQSLKKLLAMGSEFLLRDITLNKVFVTGADSLVESKAVEVSIQRTPLLARFITSVRADTILYERVTFADHSQAANQIVKWEWNFGDGKPSIYTRNVAYLYDRQGVYKVTLTITDNTGCTDKVSQNFKVGKKSPNPKLPAEQMVCVGKQTTIKPEGGKLFWFFGNAALDTLLYAGSSYSFVPLNDQIIYVVCADSLVESEPVPLYIRLSQPFLTIKIPQEVKMFETPTFTVAAEHTDIVAWFWDFGNGDTSTARNPLYSYTKQGTYTIRAVLTDRWGCKHSIAQNIKAINRANSPTLPTKQACAGQDFVVAPQGGTLFNFYAHYPNESTPPIGRGKTFVVKEMWQDANLYITCIDSAAESVPTQATIKIAKVEAAFSTNLDTLNLYDRDSLLVKANYQSPKAQYTWLLNGQVIGNETQLKKSFAKEGNYEIALTITDENGCQATQTKQLLVVNDANLSLINHFKVFPNPSRGDVALDLSLRKPSYVQVFIYNVLGQLIEQSTTDYLKDYTYQFDLGSLPKGLYFVRLVVGSQAVTRKIVVE
jgi:PKD repeat protein